jgi:hypothetical protein
MTNSKTREELLEELERLESAKSSLDSGLRPVAEARISQLKKLLGASESPENPSGVFRSGSGSRKRF